MSHEFSDIPGVREDVLQVMLNIKQLRLILHEGESARLRLEVQGEGVVTAADILALMDLTRERVHAHFGVTLEPEIRILGE